MAKLGKAITVLPGLRRLRGRLRQRLYQAAGSTDYLYAGPLRQIFLNTINEDLQADAARITVPTKLIWGEYDTEAPVADGRLLAARIPQATLHIIPSAGHFVYVDAPRTSRRAH
jgi:pimeloyl-ACP methyl ester carboxylesterase